MDSSAFAKESIHSPYGGPLQAISCGSDNYSASYPSSQNQSSSRPKPPPPKTAHIVPSESPAHPTNTDADADHFVDTKLESEIDSDHMEDQLDSIGSEWVSRECVKKMDVTMY